MIWHGICLRHKTHDPNMRTNKGYFLVDFSKNEIIFSICIMGFDDMFSRRGGYVNCCEYGVTLSVLSFPGFLGRWFGSV